MTNATNADWRTTNNGEKKRGNVFPAARRFSKPSVLRFTPTAWAKLLHLRDAGDTEVGGFGISAAGDLLLVEDVRLVQQVCTAVSVKFADASVADFYDEQVDQGRQPEQFARLWVHTHPGDSPAPSWTDEETFARCFGQSDWAVMFILAQGGQTYARLRFNVGPGGSMEIPVQVDFTTPFPAADPEAWDREYLDHVVVPFAQAPAVVADRASLWGEHDDFLEDWREYAGTDEDSFHDGGQHDLDR